MDEKNINLCIPELRCTCGCYLLSSDIFDKMTSDDITKLMRDLVENDEKEFPKCCRSMIMTPYDYLKDN